MQNFNDHLRLFTGEPEDEGEDQRIDEDLPKDDDSIDLE